MNATSLGRSVSVASFALAFLGACATTTPVRSLEHGPTGTVAFETVTLGGSASVAGTPAVITAELSLPSSPAGRVPTGVLLHGFGGVGDVEETWRSELLKLGVATFMVGAPPRTSTRFSRAPSPQSGTQSVQLDR